MTPTCAEKRRFKAGYADLFYAVSDILQRRDPVGFIKMGAPRAEYEPEAGSIVARVREIVSPDAVWPVVWEEFVWWFGDNTYVSGEAIFLAAEEIWAYVQAMVPEPA